MNHQLANIALITNSQVRFLLVAIARKLKTSYGSRIHLFCKSPQEVSEYSGISSDGLFDSITNMEVMRLAVRGSIPPEADIIAKARHYEARLGITYNTLAVGTVTSVAVIHMPAAVIHVPRHPKNHLFANAARL